MTRAIDLPKLSRCKHLRIPVVGCQKKCPGSGDVQSTVVEVEEGAVSIPDGGVLGTGQDSPRPILLNALGEKEVEVSVVECFGPG